MAVPEAVTGWRRWPRTVVLVSVASLLNDVASEMVVPVLPAFVAALGGGGVALGLVDGLAEVVAAGLKGWAGVASDRRGTSRPFVIAGYALAAAVRPVLVVASAPWHVVAVRVVDRVGKGLRSAPRDALLTAAVAPEERGAAFGFHRRMDHTGAMLGPLLALGVVTAWSEDPRWVFALSIVPGALAALVVSRVDEPARPPVPTATLAWDLGLVRAATPFALASLANAGDLFLVAKVTTVGHAPAYAAPLLWVALHLVRQEAAGRAGAWADALPPVRVVAVAWLLRAAAAGFLAAVTHPGWAAVGVVAYGLGVASEGAEKKLVAARAGQGAGRAFGAYHLALGVAAMVGAIAFGSLWDAVGPGAAFAASAAGTVFATGVLLARG